MIKKMHIPLFILLLCCFTAPCFAILSDEAAALLSVKSSLIDPLDRLSDWRALDHHCNWTGMQCSSNGAVEGLDLSHMNLSGVISDDLQNLQNLAFLNLCGNEFSSPLPKSLANLSALAAIDVSLNSFVGGFPGGLGRAAKLLTLNASSNNFSGALPEDFANLTSLESLDLRGNFFEGSIPTSYKSLRKLRFLGLSGNNLSGQIPGELGELSALETIVIGYNAFVGGIPVEFGNMTNLKYLDLAFGNVGGRIPDELGKLQKLETVYLYNNNFEHEIPPSIGNITSLLFLDLSYNMLSGSIPSEITNLKNLQLLNLMCNKVSGSIPPKLQQMAQLSVISLWNNTLSGTLPSDLGCHSPLQWLDVSSNSLSGPIPEGLCSKGNLTKLILFNNGFSGPIPTALSTCISLVRVRIQNNLLSGTIPVGFGKLANLNRLELTNNSLTGQIPSDLSSSTSLAFIDFSKNSLQSSLPFSITSMIKLQSFIVSDNNLVSNIPDQFQDCPSLSVLDLSKNHFTGEIPASIASCEKMVTLNLNGNQLTGEIPTEIAKMPTLSVLNLSNNSLTGGIPESIGNSPALETLNLSYNNLSGPVPSNGMLKSINPDDLTGNAALCGGVLPPCPHSAAAAYSSKQGLHAKHIVFGWLVGTGTLLVLVIVGLAGRTLYQKWCEGDCFRQKLSVYTSSKDWPWRFMAFQRLGFNSSDLLACLKESNVVGMGATGVVYKAEMPRHNAIVAVKKLWRTGTDVEMGSRSRDDDLVGEVNLLGKLRHRNIVRLLGFLHNDNDAMIVYEFMENGSLGETLHGKQVGRLLVDWVSRYNIALGVAQGLAYLHHDCHPPVIHRDVKSNNILLDSNLEARIADFGLAKMMIRKNETVSMVAGSYGYIAPEYGYTLKVDEKSDIYSYGVVLMELLSGRRPLAPEFGESVDIVEWMRKKIRENKPLETALDPSVGGIRHVQEEMLIVLRIAILCTARLPKDRPSMRDVITMLGEAKPRRKGSSSNVDSDATGNNTNPVFTTSPVKPVYDIL